MDLHNGPDFQTLDVALVSVATDSTDQLATAAQEYGITDVPLLSDNGTRVSEAYGVMQWATLGGEPSHTFVLVGEDGRIAWVLDYGSSQNQGVMYVVCAIDISALAKIRAGSGDIPKDEDRGWPAR